MPLDYSTIAISLISIFLFFECHAILLKNKQTNKQKDKTSVPSLLGISHVEYSLNLAIFPSHLVWALGTYCIMHLYLQLYSSFIAFTSYTCPLLPVSTEIEAHKDPSWAAHLQTA